MKIYKFSSTSEQHPKTHTLFQGIPHHCTLFEQTRSLTFKLCFVVSFLSISNWSLFKDPALNQQTCFLQQVDISSFFESSFASKTMHLAFHVSFRCTSKTTITSTNLLFNSPVSSRPSIHLESKNGSRASLLVGFLGFHSNQHFRQEREVKFTHSYDDQPPISMQQIEVPVHASLPCILQKPNFSKLSCLGFPHSSTVAFSKKDGIESPRVWYTGYFKTEPFLRYSNMVHQLSVITKIPHLVDIRCQAAISSMRGEPQNSCKDSTLTPMFLWKAG